MKAVGLAALIHATLIIDFTLVRARLRTVATRETLLLVLQANVGMGLRKLQKLQSVCDRCIIIHHIRAITGRSMPVTETGVAKRHGCGSQRRRAKNNRSDKQF